MTTSKPDFDTFGCFAFFFVAFCVVMLIISIVKDHEHQQNSIDQRFERIEKHLGLKKDQK